VQEWFRTDEDSAVYEAIFNPDVTDFFAWTIPKDGHILLGAALRKENAAVAFAALKRSLARSCFAEDRRVKREGSLLVRPHRMSDIRLAGDHAFLIGEAAGLVSPSSGEGISYALKSGFRLARCFHHPETHLTSSYRFRMVGIRLRLLLKNLKSLVIYRSGLRRFVIRSGVGATRIR
jgi:flavin-dependent dehydrogenase